MASPESTETLEQKVERKRLRSLRWCMTDSWFWACMLGFGETYYMPLLLAVGATNLEVGVFSAAPQLLIAFAQFASLYLVDRLMRRRGIIVFSAASQSFFLALTAFAVGAGMLTPRLFILIAAGYFGIGALLSPAWNSLLGDLTRAEDRGRFFGRRGGMTQIATFGAMFAGGAILQKYDLAGKSMSGFVVLMAAAAVCRFFSTLALAGHHEPPYQKSDDATFNFWQFVKKSPRSNFARFVYFTALMNFAVQMSAPYFVVYMMRDLGFSYMQYTVAQGLFILVQFLAMNRWGPFADRYGNRLALRISGTAAPFIPLLWLLSKNFYYILFIQVVAGIFWAGWSLSFATFIFDAVTPPKRAKCAAYMAFFNGIGFFLGALVGGYVSVHAPKVIATGAMEIIFYSPLQFVFVLSSALRFVSVFLFMPTIREVREVQKFEARDMFLRLAQIRPFAGARFEVFTGADREAKKRHWRHYRKGNREKGA